jgi:non-specific serine/threonine protein kinase
LGSHSNDLPGELTSFIGRDQELTDARRLLGRTRLLTLTGPGGSGKTRLSIRLAASVAADFPDGVHFVPLSAVREPALVPSSIAHHLGLHDSRGRPLLEYLAAHLRGSRRLIVLDNFEHLLSAGPVITELLKGCPALGIVVTSRSPLRVSGEQECPVPPLPVPGPETASPTAISACESVRLFVERAGAATPGFVVDGSNAVSIARIVRRLDGLPLAIELAAARVRLLPPAAIMARLDQALKLLIGGSRDLPDRQQTLRATISWSHDLLGEGARRLFAVCSVFGGGASLELLESVCQTAVDIGTPVLDALDELVDQSLLRLTSSEGPPRYMMLETVREFAAERLAELPEASRIRDAHAAAFLVLAQKAGRAGGGAGERERYERLELELDNLRTALGWYASVSPGEALRLAAAISEFWSARGHSIEGRERLRVLLDLVPDRSRTRVRALNGAAWLATDHGDYADATAMLAESLALSQDLGDSVGEGMAHLTLARRLSMNQHGAEVAAHVDRALALLRGAGNQPGVARCLVFAGVVALVDGQPGLACDRFAQSIDMSDELGLESLGAQAWQLLGIARLELGELGLARAALERGLSTLQEFGNRWLVQIGLAGFAGLAAMTGRPRQALRLAGVAAAYREDNHFSLPAPIQAMVDRWLVPARRAVGGAAATLVREGRRMSVEQAVSSALANEPDDAWSPGPRRTLSRRELEVAGLAAQGLTNREIATRLHLSVRTVDVHLDHILTKLDFHTRTQLAAWAYEQELLPKNT